VGSAVKVPHLINKNLISVIFCEACAIYGVIIAIIVSNKFTPTSFGMVQYYGYWQMAEYSGFCMFGVGLVVGFSNLACGISVGVVGSSTALTAAQNPSTFVSMLIVQIFAGALGLYGVIIGIIMANNVSWPDVGLS